ncbi:unnamed protein product [Clavelina lepadiformis]|uniref:Uncharacterized protein n=1 Tax=Clavelina lepadiformis TaxID=159417 RepID=A0ABP0GXP6_CLALP
MPDRNGDPSSDSTDNDTPYPSGLGVDNTSLASALPRDNTLRNVLFSHIKLPTFRKFNPDTWISHFEHKYSLYQITSQTNCYLLAVEAIPTADLVLLGLPFCVVSCLLRNFDQRNF